jgi:hypothetical protein
MLPFTGETAHDIHSDAMSPCGFPGSEPWSHVFPSIQETFVMTHQQLGFNLLHCVKRNTDHDQK